jgi:hypothetical protein
MYLAVDFQMGWKIFSTTKIVELGDLTDADSTPISEAWYDKMGA